ncbi:hypothetical protein M514_23751 [Trichuris suis]|uniref:Peptidase A2 domain-containing protein n=1 Tax=Trichuris suis TaxID=68888 RepID=A0A085N3J5_9BILA|nr:hypothetical protein M514_23751 [Trichuris suis]
MKPCAMEVDSGSDFSVISSKTYSKLWPTRGPVIRPFSSHIPDYQKNSIRLKGYCKVEVAYKHYKKKLRFLITEGVHQTHSEDGIRTLLEEFADVFNENLGTYKGPKVTLPIDPKVPPIRLKARNVPLAIRPRVEAEIKRLLKEKVLEPISNPKWSTPVVPVIKPTGATRLCDDYKITINTALQDHPYPVRSVMHIFGNKREGLKLSEVVPNYAHFGIISPFLLLASRDTTLATRVRSVYNAVEVLAEGYSVNMATVGNIAAFDVTKPTSWDVYVQQVQFFCLANNITEPDKKRATLLTVMDHPHIRS